MSRGDQLARQWMIVQTLITSRMGKSAGDLARDLDCHPRTVYRDLAALQAAGFPMYTEKIEGKSLWSFLDTVKHQMPIPFSLPELMALYFARDLTRIFSGTVFYDSLESLFQKVKTTLPDEAKTYLKNLEKTIQASPRPYKQFSKFKEIVHQVNEALVNRELVDIRYFTMSRNEMTKRRVAPYKLWYHDGTFYLIGHCHLQNEVRVFALDRIRMLNRTDQTFDIPDDFDIDDFIQHSFGVFHGQPVRVKIRFSSQIAGYIKEKIWHTSQTIDDQEDGSIIFEAEVAGTEEIKLWVMSWGANAIVLEPQSLVQEIKAEAAAMLNTYNTDIADHSLTA